MVSGRDNSSRWSNAGDSATRAASSRDKLNEAVTELRRLTNAELLQSMEHLCDVDGIRGDESPSVESIRGFLLWSAGCLRLAGELEAAARCCRLIEQELHRQIDQLLVSPHGQDDFRGNVGPAEPTGKSHRGIALRGWLKAISPHNQPAHGPPDKSGTPVPMVPEGLSLVPPPRPLPVASRPDADVAAMTLGPLEVIVAGRRVVRWNSLKARAVFQYLLIHRDRPVRRDVLMELEWPDHTHTSARNNLNVALYSLRNTLDGPWHNLQLVLYQDGCYELNPRLKWWVDRDEFLSALSQADAYRAVGQPSPAICHYQRAVRLYRGPLFEDDLNGGWYLPEQRQVTELYLRALESLGEIYFDLGDLASAEYSAKLALFSDPCCEPVHRVLMRCYAAQNKQQLVSRQYRLCVSALRDELGVSPGAETLRLFLHLTSAPS
jgi:DNA-binding SARP family transcriptional activator